MALTGDFAKLERLRDGIGRAPRELVSDAARAGEEGVHDEYQAGFASTRDPWGNPWAPKKSGGGRPLHGPTGGLASPQITSGSGVIRARPERYWVFHQVGANGMAERAVLPFSPSQWDAPIQSKIDAIVENYFESL